jgi:hypothetical protein
MSHFTEVQTVIKDLVILKKVLEKMGYTVHDDHRQIRGYQGNLADAELCIDTKTQYDIGVVKTANGYALMADWDMLQGKAGIEQATFVKAVNKNYAYEKVMAEVKKKGYTVVEEKTDQQQTVQIRVRKFA